MLCRQAQKRLKGYRWRRDDYSRDSHLLAHLERCSRCRSLIRAEEILSGDIVACQQAFPDKDLPLTLLKDKVTSERESEKPYGANLPGPNAIPQFRIQYKILAGTLALLLAFMALFPFNFRERVGYEVAIAGVDREIALDNSKIGALLGALGMDQDKAETLLKSLETNKINLRVGDCRETCQLKISDLRTERDVRLVVKAIIDLGCCQIDNIVPIFRNETGSLLGHAVRKLFS